MLLKILIFLLLPLSFIPVYSEVSPPVYYTKGVKVEILQLNRSSHSEYANSVGQTRGVCGSTQPYPKRICMSKIFENTQSIYHPCCIVLHRCDVDECTGPKRNKQFFVHKEFVTFTVREKNLMQIIPRYLRLTFENHTSCEYK